MTMASKKENFVVRQANSLDDLRWIMERADQENMYPREKDAEHLYAINYTPYFFLGELNGERISCIGIIKSSEDLAFVGYYIVIKPHRGKGYGYRTWKYAFEASCIGEQCDVGLNIVEAENAVMDMEKTYNKSGFKRVWRNRRYRVSASNIAEALSATTPPVGIKILPGSGVDINKLAEYDRSIFGPSRQLLIASWICVSDVSFVALNEKTEIVGYIIMRKIVRFEEEGYHVAPLFAENILIAQFLLKKAIEVIQPRQSNVLTLDVLLEGNPDGLEFWKRSCKGEAVLDLVYMTTKGVSRTCMPRNKVFAFAANEVGYI